MKNRFIYILILLIMILALLMIGVVICGNNYEIEQEEAFANCEPHDRVATQYDYDYWNKYQEEQARKETEAREIAEKQHRDEIMASETTFPNMIKDLGVNYYDGYLQTWYSSNVARHKNIGQWHLDGRGYYRDAKGYIVIAYKKGTPEGTIIKIGEDCWGIVLDECEAGNIDLYVGW